MPTVYVDRAAIDGLRPRIPKDTYLTPPELVEATVRLLIQLFPYQMGHVDRVLDPGAGRGAWGKGLRKVWPWTQPHITGIELRQYKKPEDYSAWHNRTNFMDWGRPDGALFELVIGNPPFIHAEDFVWKSRLLLDERGLICFLLPSDFSHSKARVNGILRDSHYRPAYEIALAERPMFRGPTGESLGNQNPNNYILMVWTYKSSPKTTKEWLSWR